MSRLRRAASSLAILLVPAAVWFGGRAVVAEPVRVPTQSMAPTIVPGDHVLLDKLAYRFGGAPAAGDVVALERPGTGELLIKRVVATGGQKVGIEDGLLIVDGRPKFEPFVDHSRVDGLYFGPVRVPAGHVFVLGDRREDSEDSRAFGAVARGAVSARAGLRIWPLSRLGTSNL